ncbi:serine hydroxymethyltransferase [Candidatus Jorgensenbacteria bacterium]|nr:serine hydroxymethyltransferase [Candidatus Jorgensenbacteria bacterium]
MKDKAIKKLIDRETKRQNETINLIASENYVSRDVREALGSVFTNKYAEGYPRARYYGGNVFVDELEDLVRARALKLFDVKDSVWSLNVQPYSGSPANVAVYHALLAPGEKIMGMRLDMGGHLTHGHKVSVTGKLWQQVSYGVDGKTERLNYDEIVGIAKKERPKLIVAGYSAYSRIIDFKKFREIADTVNAIFMVDMSHFAGLVAGRTYNSPFPYAHVVTTTTHKTLRGPRAAIIFSRKEFAQKIDKAIFPGLQGGPHMNAIAAVGVALHEASSAAFSIYAKQIIKNSQTLARELQKHGWRIVSGGTDTHLFLVDVQARDISGSVASDRLENVGIVVNKNAIPFDVRGPMDPSGIRIGAAAVTTRSMKEKEMKIIADCISKSLLGKSGQSDIKQRVRKLCVAFPLFS